MTITIAPDFRKRALKKVSIGVFGTLGLTAVFIALAFAGYTPNNPFVLIPVAIPFVYFCFGIVELLTGRPYKDLADAWMTLKGWQRGVIGTLIVLASGFLIIIVVAAVVMWST
jgi:hypothetical protein